MTKRTEIIAVVNQKGGVGKTTTTVNLAAALAVKGYSILIVDCDPQCNVEAAFGIQKEDIERSTYDVFTRKYKLGQVVQNTFIENIDLVPGSIDLAAVNVEFAQHERREFALRDPLFADRIYTDNIYDYILIDCPPSLDLLTINALLVADAVIIPMQCEYFSIEGLVGLIRTIRSVGANLNRRLGVYGILLTMVDRRARLTVQLEKEIREEFGDAVFNVVIPRSIKIPESISWGGPVIFYDPRSSGATAYCFLAQEIIDRMILPVL